MSQNQSYRLLDAHDLVVFLQAEDSMLEDRYAIPVPVQKHSQIFIDISLRKIVGKLLKIQYRLRNLQAIGVDSTVRKLSQAEFFSKKRNAIAVSWYGLNRLVQMSFVHVRSAGLLAEGLKDSVISALYKRKIYSE